MNALGRRGVMAGTAMGLLARGARAAQAAPLVISVYDVAGAAVFPDLEKVLQQAALNLNRAQGQGYGITVCYYPSGPLLEYLPETVKDVPATAEDLLAWAKGRGISSSARPGGTSIRGLWGLCRRRLVLGCCAGFIGFPTRIICACRKGWRRSGWRWCWI